MLKEFLSIYGPVAEYVGLHFFQTATRRYCFLRYYIPKEAIDLEKADTGTIRR